MNLVLGFGGLCFVFWWEDEDDGDADENHWNSFDVNFIRGRIYKEWRLGFVLCQWRSKIVKEKKKKKKEKGLLFFRLIVGAMVQYVRIYIL